MSNLPPDWPGEPRLHYTGCALWCGYASLSIIEDSEYDCPDGHKVPHACTCDDLAWADAEQQVEALLDAHEQNLEGK